MKLDAILNEWEKDSKVEPTELDTESLKIPTLHHKYLKIYTSENLLLRKLTHEYKEQERIRFEYYSGKLDKEDLDTLGLEQFDQKVLKQDIHRYLDADPKLISMLLKLDYQREKIEALKSILSSINNRSFNINNAIKWQQFLQGVG